MVLTKQIIKIVVGEHHHRLAVEAGAEHPLARNIEVVPVHQGIELGWLAAGHAYSLIGNSAVGTLNLFRYRETIRSFAKTVR